MGESIVRREKKRHYFGKGREKKKEKAILWWVAFVKGQEGKKVKPMKNGTRGKLEFKPFPAIERGVGGKVGEGGEGRTVSFRAPSRKEGEFDQEGKAS